MAGISPGAEEIANLGAGLQAIGPEELIVDAEGRLIGFRSPRGFIGRAGAPGWGGLA